MDEGVPYYNVVLNGTALLEDGTLGLNTTAGSFQNNLTLVSEETDSGDETWTPLVGDKSVIEDRFNETAVTLSNAEGKTVTIEMRAYNTGVAFRYVLPEMKRTTRSRTNTRSLPSRRARSPRSMREPTRPSRRPSRWNRLKAGTIAAR